MLDGALSMVKVGDFPDGVPGVYLPGDAPVAPEWRPGRGPLLTASFRFVVAETAGTGPDFALGVFGRGRTGAPQSSVSWLAGVYTRRRSIESLLLKSSSRAFFELMHPIEITRTRKSSRIFLQISVGCPPQFHGLAVY
jgi:hypothetical protein